MKAYWDSAALVEACFDLKVRERLRAERGLTRSHALSEVFSAITGKSLPMRFDADDAANAIDNLATDLEFVDLTEQEVRRALHSARRLGVRGGRVHDYLHAVAAEKAGAKVLLTLDQSDFDGLVETVAVVQLSQNVP
jgi:predicted nucleic acid-binding protein